MTRGGVILAVLLLAGPTHAGEVHVAVAANFSTTMKQIAGLYTKAQAHHVIISSASTGKLYAQIRNGAPYDVLLAADGEHPLRLEREGMAVAGSRFTYARGVLVLWSRDRDRVDDQGSALRQGRFNHLAMANPVTAPYGAAAQEALQGLGLWSRVRERIVQGESIGQAFQFVATGNAEIGLVSLAQALQAGSGSTWRVPAQHYKPLDQQAVLLRHGGSNPAAASLLQFLQTPEVRAMIERSGYSVP
jgi:molybdate transport system substrate-binding protein